MTQPPKLFDLTALAQRRARAARAPVDVLQREAAEQVAERLVEVNRRFKAAAIVGPMADLWRDVLRMHGAVEEVTTLPDAPMLDLEEGCFDLVVHALALHWADDPVGQLVQMRRALRPDGLAIAVLFGGRSLHELRAVLAETEVAQRGGLSPRVAPMGDLRDLGGLVQRAGLALPVADSNTLTLTYANLMALVHDLRAMGETNVMMTRDTRPLSRDFWRAAQARYAQAFPAETPDRITATAELVFLTGWAPAASQQRPLRPGSAQVRLAETLGTQEVSAGDAAGPRRKGD